MRALVRAAAALAASCLVVVMPVASAQADTGVNFGVGSAPGISGAPAGIIGPGSAGDLVSSGYSMAGVDPLSGTMSLADVTSAMSPAQAVVSDLASQDLLAINEAELARKARAEEEARRRAASGQAGGGLKKGSVPTQYHGLILDAVARYCPNLEPSILAAQIQSESNWNPRARSPVGAMGIAQFMPGTWASSGVDGNADGRKDVWDPADAIPSAAAYDCHVAKIVKNVPGDKTANMLAAYNAGAGRVLQFKGVPPYAETRNYIRRITTLAEGMREEVDTSGNPGSAGGPDGCPTSAPSGTLREGAESIGVAKLCADAVAGASSPYAARAIKYALRNLGAPYSQPRRMDTFKYDCSSLVTRAYTDAGLDLMEGGWAPTTFTIVKARWAAKVQFGNRKPGDMVLPHSGHVAMALSPQWMVHTNRTGDVSHVKRMYGTAWQTVRVMPGRV